jgi:hypothetical protein
MHDRSEWTRGEHGPVKIGRKTYNNLVEFTRPCQTCSEPFAVYVTTKIANGLADSNSFALKNCPKHRRNKSATDEQEVETLRTANITMREELKGLYERVHELQARLAQYELPAAMRAAACAAAEPQAVVCETVQNTTASKNENVPKNSLTFPWQTS